MRNPRAFTTRNRARSAIATAVWLKIAPEEWLHAGGAFYGDPEDPSFLTFADGAEKLATEQARLSWALRYPMGGGQTPLDIVRGRLVLRQMKRDARERARTVPTPVPTSARKNAD